MATYYGYADRDASSQVNWAEVGKNMTDMLQEQIRIRENKKAELDKASREFGETLANAPTGQNDGLNGFALNHANEASKFRLMQDRLLKQGLLDVRAYTIGRQNIVDGTKKAFDMATNLQTVFAAKKEKYDKGELGEADLQLMAKIESFGKLDNTRTYVNPTNGTVSIGQMVKNPDGTITMTENPNGYLSINEMGTIMQKDIGKFKLDAALEAQVKRTGGEIQSFMKDPGVQRTGSITSISDPILKKRFPEYLKNIIDAETVNDFHNMSTLMDYVNVNPKTGKAWEISFDSKDKSNPDVIYLEKDGQGYFKPVLNDEQNKLVRNYLETKYLGMLDREVKQSSVGAISPAWAPEYVYNAGKEEKQKDIAVGAWDKLRSGTNQEKKDAVNILIGTTRAQELGLLDIDLTSKPGYALLKYSKPEKNREIEITSNGERWSAIGNELHQQDDVNKARKAAGDSWQKPINTDYTGVRATRQGGDYSAEMSSYTSQNVPSSFVEDSGKKTAENLNAKFKNLGFVFEGDWKGLANDYIIITAPDGQTKSGKISVDNEDNISQIEAFLNANLDNSKAANVFKRQAGGSPTNAGGASSSGGNAR